MRNKSKFVGFFQIQLYGNKLLSFIHFFCVWMSSINTRSFLCHWKILIVIIYYSNFSTSNCHNYFFIHDLIAMNLPCVQCGNGTFKPYWIVIFWKTSQIAIYINVLSNFWLLHFWIFLKYSLAHQRQYHCSMLSGCILI